MNVEMADPFSASERNLNTAPPEPVVWRTRNINGAKWAYRDRRPLPSPHVVCEPLFASPPPAIMCPECARIKALINTPEIEDFDKGVPLEAAHQVGRWGEDHDAGKGPLDWFWLVGYLSQKAATAAIAGDLAKAKHHTISTAAAMRNWHAALSGGGNRMRPGIAEPTSETAAATTGEG